MFDQATNTLMYGPEDQKDLAVRALDEWFVEDQARNIPSRTKDLTIDKKETKMKEIQAPNSIITEDYTVFLAGSIEMGKAINWQDQVKTILADTDIVVLNPRRDDWDSSWVQSKDHKQFRTQVEWELCALELADRIVMYFDVATKSPISLLELGLFARSGKLIVCCPDGFWRKGNVDIVCERYGIPMIEGLEEIKRFVPG